jgi:hypothetical protein
LEVGYIYDTFTRDIMKPQLTRQDSSAQVKEVVMALRTVLLFGVKSLILLASIAASQAFSSGGVHCQSIGEALPPVGLSWGTGHVEGGGRIGPYRLTLSGREVMIAGTLDPQNARQTSKNKESIQLNEVGYWNGQDRLMVWLADGQLIRPVLVLETTHSKAESYEGTLSIKDLKGVSLEAKVGCSKE